MNDQYYTAVPTSESAPKTLELEFAGEHFEFMTDNGVFSKGGLDDGTRILLNALPSLSGRVLDLGCGWGPVGTILGRLYPDIRLVMSDVNQRALELAGRNLARNSVTNAQVIESDAFTALSSKFDCIITNPPIRAGKQVIYGMFDSAYEFLERSGSLFIVIRKQQGAPSAVNKLTELFGNAEIISKEKSYWVIKGEKQ